VYGAPELFTPEKRREQAFTPTAHPAAEPGTHPMKKDVLHKSPAQLSKSLKPGKRTLFPKRSSVKNAGDELGTQVWSALEEPSCPWQSSFSDRIKKTELLTAEAERALGEGLQAVRNELLELLLGARLVLDWIFSEGKSCGAVDCKSLPKDRVPLLLGAMREADTLFLELQNRPSAAVRGRFESVRDGIRRSLAGCTLHVSWMEPLFELIERTRRDLARLRDTGSATSAGRVTSAEALERTLWIPAGEMDGFFASVHRLHAMFLARRNQLVESNLRLAAVLAEKRRNLGLPVEDLVQEGNLALVSVAEFFDPSRARFSTFATLKIDSFLLRANDNSGYFIGRPVHVCERMRKIAKAERSLFEQNGENPSVEDLAVATGIAPDEIESLLQLRQPVDSLDASLAPGGPTLLETLADNPAPVEDTDFQAAA
jgi:RNA polymerase sigma factor (sigma-70 family)